MTTQHSQSVGVQFDCPASWVVNPNEGVSGPKTVSVVMVGEWKTDQVRPQLMWTREDAGAPTASIDVTAPAPAAATVSRVFTVDGIPARLTGCKLPTTGQPAEMLTVQVAKGGQFYTLSMTFPAAEHDEYVRLLNAICASTRF